jgi:hypothetical protein
MNGYNFSLYYPVEKCDVLDVQGPDDNFHYKINHEDGIISVIWNSMNNPAAGFESNILFHITIKIKDITTENINFDLVPGGQFIGADGYKLGYVELTLPEIILDLQSSEQLTTYHHPTANQLTISFESKSAERGLLKIYDILGRLVDVISLDLKPSRNEFILQTEKYMPGDYFLMLEIGNPATQVLKGRWHKSSS